MDKKRELRRLPGILLLTGSAIGLLLWVWIILLSFFLGGPMGPPDFQRGVPMIYVKIMNLGLIGAGVGLFAGIRHMRGKVLTKTAIILAILLDVAGSAPFFLMDGHIVAVIILLMAILPWIGYMLTLK